MTHSHVCKLKNMAKEMLNQQPRMDWLDCVKAIGMILVYIGHCHIPGVNKYIYLFHMPLFFIISGYLWNIEKNKSMNFKTFFQKKFKSYIIPYFKIASVCFVVWGVCINYFRLNGFSDEYLRQIAQYIFGIFIYSRGTIEWLPQCSPIWFLACLFVAEIVYYFIMKMRIPVVGVFLAGILGFIFSGWLKLPWNIDNAFSAIVLLYIGMLIRKYWSLLVNWKIIIPISLIAVFVLCTNETKVDFDGNKFSNILAMYVKSSILSFSVLTIIYKWGGVEKTRHIWKRNNCVVRI